MYIKLERWKAATAADYHSISVSLSLAQMDIEFAPKKANWTCEPHEDS